jgi:DNA-binding CsgD family transcriptional regulator
MPRHVLLYVALGGVLIGSLKFIEYRWLVLEHSWAIYGGLVAALCAGFGLWLGLRVTRPAPPAVVREVIVPAPAVFERDERNVATLGLTPRELEVLALIAEGLSTKEIATRAFVSENTVKTHASRLYDKLGVRRRTQAVLRGRELKLIP